MRPLQLVVTALLWAMVAACGATASAGITGPAAWYGPGPTHSICVHQRDSQSGDGETCGPAPAPRVWSQELLEPSGPHGFELDEAATTVARETTADACCYAVTGPSLGATGRNL
jgi:hypothetical protein